MCERVIKSMSLPRNKAKQQDALLTTKTTTTMSMTRRTKIKWERRMNEWKKWFIIQICVRVPLLKYEHNWLRGAANETIVFVTFASLTFFSCVHVFCFWNVWANGDDERLEMDLSGNDSCVTMAMRLNISGFICLNFQVNLQLKIYEEKSKKCKESSHK